MRAPLAVWQGRLDSHFASLSKGRSTNGWPVFALEHGLSDADLGTLETNVRAALVNRSVLDSGPLPWIVYSAEFGYGYTGEEFWQTFATETVGWPNTDFERRSLRHQFEGFAARYHGAEPEGRWGTFFKNIAWPITHAILPRDLQRQLARVLYDASQSFREDTFKVAESLGRHLKDNCRYRSARFRQFAENTTLLGQIAFALLLQEEGTGEKRSGSHETVPIDWEHHKVTEMASAGESTLILPVTLNRIITDLNKERESRDWLMEARRAAQSAAKVRMRGLAGLRRREIPGTADDDRRTALPETLSLEPNFVLREQSSGAWRVWVEFPNMRAIAEILPGTRNTLFNAQGSVAGARGVMLAKGRIVSDPSPSVRLYDWPSATTLLSFEGSPPELRALLDASFRGLPGHSWLFKIGADGQADHVKVHVLQPGASYVLLRRIAIEKPAAGLSSTVVDCAGVFGIRIDMPFVVPENLFSYLRLLGLSVSRSLRVWPAGIPVPKWSDDGIGEWLVRDDIVLGVSADHAGGPLTVSLDGAAKQTLLSEEASRTGPSFIYLGKLAEGRHRITISTTYDESAQHGWQELGLPATESSGVLDVIVRPPRSSDLNGARSSALSFVAYPDPPTLEDLWEGRCEIHLAAAGISTVRCRVELYDQVGSGPIWSHQLPPLPLPINTDRWRTTFERHVRDTAGEQYDAAQRCRIEFDAGPLGLVGLVAERDYIPLRWSVRNGGRKVTLMYADAGETPHVTSFESSEPTVEREIPAAEAEQGLPVPPKGALFTANAMGVTASVVAVPPRRLSGSFAALSSQPRIASKELSGSDLARLVEAAALWDGARASANPLAGSYRAHAVDAVGSRIFGAIGGPRWATVESEFEAHGNLSRAAAMMKPLVSDQRREQGVAAALEQRAEELSAVASESRVAIFSSILAAFLEKPRDHDVASRDQFVLRLATRPAAAIDWLAKCYGLPAGAYAADAPLRLRGYLVTLGSLPVVTRAARYCAVVTAFAQSRQRNVSLRTLAEAWTWN